MHRYLAIAAFAAVIFMLGITYFLIFRAEQDGAGGDRFAQCREGVIAGGAGSIGGPFELVSETGETLTDKEVIDRPALLYFGYTFCPDVCPYDAARNAQTVDILAEQGADVKPVFITIDPNRDTPEVLREFTDAIHPDMLGLTGSEEQIAAAAKAYRTIYGREGDPEENPYYTMSHMSFTYLTLPEHGFVDFFRNDLSAEEMADKVQCFLEAS